MTQRQTALAIVAAILVGLLLAAVVVGLLIGAAVRSVASGEGPVQVRTEQPASAAELEDAYELGTGALEVNSRTWTSPRTRPLSRRASTPAP